MLPGARRDMRSARRMANKPMSMSDQNRIPSKLQVWMLASRPQTLTASIAPVFVGYTSTLQIMHCNSDRHCDSAALGDGTSTILLLLAIQFAVFASLIQIATNLHNDYADFVKGADTNERVGQARATQKGWLTPYETCRGCTLCLLGAFWVGSYCLIPLNDQCAENIFGRKGLDFDPVMVFVVLSSLFNAVAYTGGPFPLGYIGLGNISIGYSGLGDLFVFLYFGIVATMGAPYLYATKVACLPQTRLQQALYPSFARSLPIGFLAAAVSSRTQLAMDFFGIRLILFQIIVVNNLRDRHTDICAGKKTMAVRFGGAFARVEYLALVVGRYGFSIYFWTLEKETYTTLLPLLSFPMAIPQLKAVSFGGKDGQALNEHVGGTAKLQMFYCILMAGSLYLKSKDLSSIQV